MSLVLPASSPALTPAPLGSSQSLSTALINWPDNANFQIHQKPIKGVTPVNGGKIPVSELISGEGTYLLVCVEDFYEQRKIAEQLDHGRKLDIPVLLVGSSASDFIASILHMARALTGLHGLTREPTRPTVFSPSMTLSRLLGIITPDNRSSRTRNALILIRDGRVCTSWVSGGEGQDPHDWTKIEKALKNE